jgi:hypothetical protein
MEKNYKLWHNWLEIVRFCTFLKSIKGALLLRIEKNEFERVDGQEHSKDKKSSFSPLESQY